MTKEEYIERVNEIRLRMCKEVAILTIEYIKQNQNVDFNVRSDGLCVKQLPSKDIAQLSFHGMIQRDFSLCEKEQRRISLRNKITQFFKSYDKTKSLTIEELEKIESVIKNKL